MELLKAFNAADRDKVPQLALPGFEIYKRKEKGSQEKTRRRKIINDERASSKAVVK